MPVRSDRRRGERKSERGGESNGGRGVRFPKRRRRGTGTKNKRIRDEQNRLIETRQGGVALNGVKRVTVNDKEGEEGVR